MGRRTFDVVDLTELFVHWEAGRSQVQISESLNLDRKTVRKFLAPALAEGLVPGGPPAGELVWAQRIAGWFPGLSDARLRQVTWPAIEVHRDYIVAQLADEVTVSTISSRLSAERGLTASESSVRRWITANLAEEAARRRVSVPRGPVEPGSEAQIDYGRLGSWTDPATGIRHIVQAFVMVLACSRLIFVRPVIRMDQTSWCDSHVEAFTFFQGCPARLVPDNLKTGVDRPDLYDPRINRAYAELAAHYGVLADPARAFKPKDKVLVSYCASWGGWGRNSAMEPVSSVAEQVRVAGVGGLVEPFVLVVGFVGDEQAGAAPGLDGVGMDAELLGDFGDSAHALCTESFRVAGELVFLSDVNDNCCVEGLSAA